MHHPEQGPARSRGLLYLGEIDHHFVSLERLVSHAGCSGSKKLKKWRDYDSPNRLFPTPTNRQEKTGRARHSEHARLALSILSILSTSCITLTTRPAPPWFLVYISPQNRLFSRL